MAVDDIFNEVDEITKNLKNRKNKDNEISFDIMTGFMISFFPLIIC